MRHGVVQKTRRHQKVHACCVGRYDRQRRFPVLWPAATGRGFGAAHKNFYLVFCCGGFLVPVSPAYRDEARGMEVQCGVSVRGALCLPFSLFKPSRCRSHVQEAEVRQFAPLPHPKPGGYVDQVHEVI